MAAICIRGLPDIAKRLLRVQAAHAGLSMEELARRILVDGLLAERPSPGGLVDSGAVDSVPAGGYPDGPEPDPVE